MPLVSTFGGASSKGFGLFSAPAAVLDQYFEYVTLLLPGNGTNGAQNNTFLDSSTNNFTITRNGNTTQGTFTPYGSNWSNYFDGTGDYLSWSGTTLSADFTVECWVYKTAVDASGYTNVFSSSFANNQLAIDNASTGSISLVIAGSVVISSSGTAVTANAWHHLAWVRQGSTCRAYVNGVQQGTGTSSASLNLTLIGQFQTGGYEMNGYISNVRITNACLYPSGTTFTPSTTPLTTTVSTGTVQLLTCQSNRFIDNSTNNFTITVNGNTSVQRFSPFSPSASYSAATIGGSGYFDGSGDYLTVPSTTAFDMNGDFTLEMWVYPNQLNQSNTATVFACGNTSVFQLNTLASGSKIEWYANGPAIISVSYLGYLQLKQWNHLVACRTGTTLAIFVNGTRLGTATDSTSYDLSQLYLSFQPASSHFLDGYMGDVRVIKGSGPYNATLTTLTVPTAPLTAITNTSLLLNFTNAGIIDNAMMNDLETVGNAQISTTQSKFGGSSMYFDGTGDYLTAPNNKILSFESGDFTVECWFYANSLSASDYAALMGFHDGSNTSSWGAYVRSNGVFIYGSGATLTGGGTVNTATWYHFAATRSGNTIRVFLNGTQQATATVSGSYVDGGLLFRVGEDNAGSNPAFNGYIDDLRITKGVARYTANFTPPTAAFPTR